MNEKWAKQPYLLTQIIWVAKMLDQVLSSLSDSVEMKDLSLGRIQQQLLLI